LKDVISIFYINDTIVLDVSCANLKYVKLDILLLFNSSLQNKAFCSRSSFILVDLRNILVDFLCILACGTLIAIRNPRIRQHVIKWHGLTEICLHAWSGFGKVFASLLSATLRLQISESFVHAFGAP